MPPVGHLCLCSMYVRLSTHLRCVPGIVAGLTGAGATCVTIHVSRSPLTGAGATCVTIHVSRSPLTGWVGRNVFVLGCELFSEFAAGPWATSLVATTGETLSSLFSG
jgi:hypothetical protein